MDYSGKSSPMSNDQGYLPYLTERNSQVTKHSAHYLVKKDGSIEQLITPEEVSWGPLIHKEPDCLGYNHCRSLEPHEHGFACDKTCIECWGQCHSECPANEVHNG